MQETADSALLLIDGTNIVRTIYEAQPGEDTQERADAAIRNAESSFRRAMKTHKSTHNLVPFDFGGRQWRHDIYPDYHASRKPMPQVLRDSLPKLYEKLADMGFHVACVPEVEADDVIATCFYKWSARTKAPAIVLSSDKDILKLVEAGAHVRDHFDKKQPWRDRDYVLNKFGVPPELIQDYLALSGDGTDDVPGVDKVGAKTAAKWLLEYGSLEGVLANADKLTGVAGKNLREQVDRALMSKQLVSFKTDVHVGVTWNSIRTH